MRSMISRNAVVLNRCERGSRTLHFVSLETAGKPRSDNQYEHRLMAVA
jgi:hypothetical protein